jgi:hypothetical protein
MADPNCFVFNVFDSYLRDTGEFSSPAVEASVIETMARIEVLRYCKDATGWGSLPVKLLGTVSCKFLSENFADAGTLYAGALHFQNELDPGFKETISAVVMSFGPEPQLTTLRTALSALRQQHDDLINHAVLPGFIEVHEAGHITLLAREIAKASVPFAAVCVREQTIYEVLGQDLYFAVTDKEDMNLRSSRRCALLVTAAGACPELEADIDIDGLVSILDLAASAGSFGQSISIVPPHYDQDGDGVMSVLDLSRVAGLFGRAVSACP